MLKEIYRHALDDRQKEMNDKANSYFEKLCNTDCNTKQKKYRKSSTFRKLLTGIEPVTSSLPMRCATDCATTA